MNQPEISIKELYPNLSEAELREADENIAAYLALVVRIYQSQQTQGFEQ